MTTVDGAPSGFETVACPMCGPRGEKILFEIVESNDPRQPRTWRGSARIPVVRCQVCGLVFLNPRYDEGRLHAIYQDPKIFSETVDPDGRRRNISSERVRRVKAFEAEVRALRKVCGGGRILDVGCGLGFFLEAAMPFFDGVGLDWSKVAVEEANRRGIRVVESRFPDHPFSTGMFDLVTLFSTLDHLSNPLSALRQVFTFIEKKRMACSHSAQHCEPLRDSFPKRFPTSFSKPFLLFFSQNNSSYSSCLRVSGGQDRISIFWDRTRPSLFPRPTTFCGQCSQRGSSAKKRVAFSSILRQCHAGLGTSGFRQFHMKESLDLPALIFQQIFHVICVKGH